MHVMISSQGHEITLTTEHSASSYGIPVALIAGQSYGPGDMLPEPEPGPDWLEEIIREMPEAERNVGRIVASVWRAEHTSPGHPDVDPAEGWAGPNAFGCRPSAAGYDHSEECALVRLFLAALPDAIRSERSHHR